MSESEPLLLTPKEAAKSLKICERHLRSLKKGRKIPYVPIGGCVRYDVRDLLAYIDQQKIGALAC